MTSKGFEILYWKLKLISDTGKFIIDFSSQSNEVILSFSSMDVSEIDERLCDLPICLFVTGGQILCTNVRP